MNLFLADTFLYICFVNNRVHNLFDFSFISQDVLKDYRPSRTERYIVSESVRKILRISHLNERIFIVRISLRLYK